ncbi:FG-GAP-like repeat-containing protein [Streptomyces dysideae]|nr:FG-GAP-like repeat-containing protein [Streptomyces dysideae]
MRFRTGVLLTAALTPLALSAPAAHAATAAAPYDFNGDGRADLAIGAPGATVGGKAKAGAVSVVYGSTSGLKSSTYTLITQNTTGVPGTAEADDAFGTAVASADLNTDGYADLLIGAPGEDLSGDTNAGMVTVVWGSASGLSGARTFTDPFRTDYDRYGKALAAGDFDGDGDPDVAVGSTGSIVLTTTDGPFTKTGAFNGSEGSGNGWWNGAYGVEHLSSGDVTGEGLDSLILHSRALNSDDAVTAVADGRISNYMDWLRKLPGGYASSVGDIDGDGHADIAVGNHREPSADPAGAKGGKVTVVYGGPDGPDTTRTPLVLTQNTAGVPGASETGDRFGGSVSLGDLNGDGHADLAIGTPGENTDTGMITVLFGSATGLKTTGVQSFTQNTAGVPGVSETGDRFGGRVEIADRAWLAVSAPGENGGDGAAWSLRTTSTGLTTTGATIFGPSSTGVSTAGSPGYGTTLGG